MAHFWFSWKQLKHHHESAQALEYKEPEVLIDGKWQPFTIQSETKNHGCKWDDFTYLGETDTRNVKIGVIDQRQLGGK